MDKKFQLTIPQRIVYAPYTGRGTDSFSCYSESGERVKLAFFPEVYSPPVKVRCSFMKNKRTDGHHSAVTHCQVLAPPSVMHNIHACHRYVNGHGRDLLTVALGGSDRLAFDGESICSMDPTQEFTSKSRTWKTGFASRERFYVEEHQEFAKTLNHDRWGLTGHWPSYPCRDCKVRAIILNEDGTIESIGGTLFRAHMIVSPTKQAAENRAVINSFIRRIERLRKSPIMGRFEDSVDKVGSYWVEKKSWEFKPSPSDHLYSLIPFHEDTSQFWPDLDLQHSFQYNEPSWFTNFSRLSIVYTDVGIAKKVKTMRAEAFMNATEDIAVANDNLIQTVVECVSMLKSVAQGEFSNLRRVSDFRRLLPQHLTDVFDLWLQYRYSYSTNKMDIEDFVKFLSRTYGKSLLGTMSIKGSYTSDNVTCRCQAVLRSRNVHKLQKCLHILDRYGLCPDFYIVWDTIPYSFIIDWFAPIGDMVSRTDAQIRYSKLNYELLYVSYSLAYTAPARLTRDQQLAYGNLNVKCYTRWQESEVPDLCWMYSDMELSTNYWTWTKRGLDVACLLAGKAFH